MKPDCKIKPKIFNRQYDICNVCIRTLILSFLSLFYILFFSTFFLFPETLKYKFGVQWVSFISWGEGASLVLVGHPSSDDFRIKGPHGIDVLLQQCFITHTPSFPIELVKTESEL